MTLVKRNVEVINPHISTSSTMFLIKVEGNSMVEADINHGDYLLVDRNYQNVNGAIVIAELNGAWTVKRLYYNDLGEIELVPENPTFPIIKVSETDNFKVIGKVVNSFRSFN